VSLCLQVLLHRTTEASESLLWRSIIEVDVTSIHGAPAAIIIILDEQEVVVSDSKQYGVLT
jgi:hypothetical protein